MAFTLTCKCPSCDRITSQCSDTSLTKDRTEYDGVRCKRCARAGQRKSDMDSRGRVYLLAAGTGAGMFRGKKRAAVRGFNPYA
jgi:hypothetical protein